jgi:hypothetical protein
LDAKRGDKVKLPHLVGQRFEALETAICADGPFGKEGAAALKDLRAFREHDALRTPLSHGLGKISVDQAGRWTLVLRMMTLKARRAERFTMVWEEEEAKILADRIHADAQRLQSRLATLAPTARASSSSG